MVIDLSLMDMDGSSCDEARAVVGAGFGGVYAVMAFFASRLVV